jgi:hypothetical protein
MANIDQFRAQLVGGGARASQFQVMLTFPSWVQAEYPSVAVNSSFLIKAATLPASNIQPIDVAFRGRMAKIAGERVFENWNVVVINDNNFLIRNALEFWSKGVLNHATTNGRIEPRSYIADLTVDQLDRNDVSLKQYKFYNCFPQVISEIQLDYANINTIEEFQVQFSVDYWQAAPYEINAITV